MRLPYERIHIVGAGGAGMSALAKLLMGMGATVSGSDLRGGVTLDGLADLGADVFTGHNPDVAVRADLVVASSAVPEYDEELEAARNAGIPVWRRPELIEALSSGTTTLGATGTHGKTTTTALVVHGLRGAGLDPSFVVGGEINRIGSSGHLGESQMLVIEADEAFRTFESIHLNGLVVTNVEVEHIEHFGTEQDLLDSFVSVASAVDGPVLACADDEGSAQVASRASTLTYGSDPASDWRLGDVVPADGGSRFTIEHAGEQWECAVSVPGRHVALNATGAFALLSELGHDQAGIIEGIAQFRGVGRRWDNRGTVAGVTLIDDYAHHPTEIRATLEAARSFTDGTVWAVFQPHLYSRTARFHDEFGEAMAMADHVVVTDVYGAREAPVPGVTGELVSDAAAARGADTHYVPHRADLGDFLASRVRDGDLVLSMGAGDITLLHTELAAIIGERS